MDFLPTLLDLCDLPAADTAEGVSYAPLIRGDAQPVRDAVFAEYGDELCIRTQTEKLVTDRPTAAPRALYDLEADPYEQVSLVDDLAHQARRESLRQTLVSWYHEAQIGQGEHRGTASQPARVPDL